YGSSTTYSYTDNFYTDNGQNPPATYTPGTATNAYLTQVTVPILGSSTSGYYFNTGNSSLATDTNGKTVYQHYQDSLDRFTKVVLPNGGSTTNTFADRDTVTSTTIIAGSTTLQTSTDVDVWARPTKKTLVDPDGDTTSEPTYNSSGRVQSM